MNQSEILEEVDDIVSDKDSDYGNSWQKVSVLKRVIADKDGPQTITLESSKVMAKDGENMLIIVETDEDFFKETNEVEFVQLADTPERNTLFKEQVDDLFTRLLDKVVRGYYTTLVKAETLVDDESKIDAFKDLVGYAALGGSLVHQDEE